MKGFKSEQTNNRTKQTAGKLDDKSDRNRLKVIKKMKEVPQQPTNLGKIEPQKVTHYSNKEDNTIEEQTTIRPETSKGLANKFKDFPSNKEREYLKYFNTCESLIRSKEFKYIEFIGKKLATENEEQSIVLAKNEEIRRRLETERKLAMSRHLFENENRCLVDRNNKYLLTPTFDFNSNDKFYKTRHYFNVFLKGVTKVLINNRADKRLKLIKRMIKDNNIRSVVDFEKFIETDLIRRANLATTSSNNKSGNAIIFFTPPTALWRTEVFITNDYNVDSLKQQIAHENNITLEEFPEFKQLERFESEVIGYKEFKSDGITAYDVSTQDKVFRSCGQNESQINTERGDPEISFGKIESYLKLPETYLKHVSTSSTTLLINDSSAKKYSKYITSTEHSLDYNLQPRCIKTANNTNIYSNYSDELYSILPLGHMENWPTNEVEEDFIQQCYPKQSAPVVHSEDLNGNGNLGKIDEDNYIHELGYGEEEKLLETFEREDETVKLLRDKNKKEIHDEKRAVKTNLENYHSDTKVVWTSTIPTVIDINNSTIINQTNKLFY